MEQRILIYTPTGQDGPLTAKVLAAAGIVTQICGSATELARQLELGAGGVVTVEEVLSTGGFKVLAGHVSRQASWSDLPIILLTHHGSDSLAVRQAVAGLGNVTLLERPVRTLTLITSVHAILRARARQYLVRETDRRKDEFLASLGHELRNPLAPIKTSVALLDHLHPDSAPVARIRGVVERQVTHLTRLVDDLLDVARITSGKIELRRGDVSFGAVIGHAGELCAQPAAAKNIAISFDLPQPDPMLHADYARVVQIFANILSNAVKFTPAGGRIAVRARTEGGWLHVSIKDSGIGLEAEAIARIFIMFEQSKTISGQISSGLGIGLSLSRRFAEMHGGRVDARSDGPGLGSEFLVDLPLAHQSHAAPVAAVEAPAAPATASKNRGSVLIVDDNRDAADSLAALFEMESYDVDVAYDGYAALAALDQRLPRLIVMDLGMPGLDGYEAARLIRQRPEARGTLLVALTGWGQSDARRRTLDAGFDHHLIKPVDFQALLDLATGLS
jgi:signal transduction histidine kinase/CheY-like chemotaxis protein